MKEVTDYYFDLQNIADIDDCMENCNDNVLLLFKQIIKSILKDNNDYDITILDKDTELFKMTGGDGVSTFPYNHFEEIMDFLFQKSKFIQEKKEELYNSLFGLDKKNEIGPIVPVTDSEPPIIPVTDSEPPIIPVTDSETLDGGPYDNQAPIGVPSDNQAPIGVPSDNQAPFGVPSDNKPPFGGPSDNQYQNNQNIINQIGGYKKTQNKLFSNIKNIITIKISVYNNAIKKSFLKKLKINDSFYASTTKFR
jgi:hypothetical protein